MTIRFALDKTFLQDEVFDNKFDHPLVLYGGPSCLEEGLSCRKCSGLLVKGPILKIKGAPTENWREVIELWQCHNENYDRYIDADTHGIVVPKDVCLSNFNRISLSSNKCHSLTDLAGL